MRRHIPFLALAASALTGIGSASAEGDPERGALVFRECRSCHVVDADGPQRTGPHLADLLGRQAGSLEGARYSDAMIEAGEDGLIWTAETLDGFLTNPRAYLRGVRMSFGGIGDLQERQDLIAFLIGTDPGIHAPETARLPDEVLAIEGDVAYGEYLSQECTACHSRDATENGIPAITVLPYDSFVLALHDYRDGHRDHQVMNTVTARLTDEEIASLASYFATLAE